MSPRYRKMIAPAASRSQGSSSERPSELDFDLQESFVIGDKPADIEMGRQVRATTFLVRTGYGAEFVGDPAVNPDYVADDLSAAAQTIQRLLDANERESGPMIISRTPFRVSFFGGGTDYPAWYRTYGGAVLATTIDKYCYLSCRYLPPFFEHKIRVVYSKIENCHSVEEIAHPAVREILRYCQNRSRSGNSSRWRSAGPEWNGHEFLFHRGTVARSLCSERTDAVQSATCQRKHRYRARDS